MADLTPQEILATREAIITQIKKARPDAEILNTYFTNYTPSGGNIALKYLAKSLEYLADADEAWFAPGWEFARGCRIEYDCCLMYDIRIIEVKE